ncbi:MAG TPA: AzlD domain-containing protein [Gammaproteobacteria bacterium]|jgi:branched-subunit amino acid transport protein
MNEAVLISCGILGTYLWRALGVAFSARIQPEGAMFRWVNCVSYAMLAGLISRMTILPLGSLADTPVVIRLGAMGVAICVFFMTRKNVPAGLSAGVATFIVLTAVGGA